MDINILRIYASIIMLNANMLEDNLIVYFIVVITIFMSHRMDCLELHNK